MSVPISAYKRCSIRLYLQLFIGVRLSYFRYLCLFAYSDVQHILYCIFVLFFFVLYNLCCQFLWIVHFVLPLRYSLTFISRIGKRQFDWTGKYRLKVTRYGLDCVKPFINARHIIRMGLGESNKYQIWLQILHFVAMGNKHVRYHQKLQNIDDEHVRFSIYSRWYFGGRRGSDHMVVGFWLPMQSVPITTEVVSSNPAHGEVYSI
jgi:hypothetical protein